MARPVIAADLGGPRETVEEGVTGWRVPPGDPAALAAAIGPRAGHAGGGARGDRRTRARGACWRATPPGDAGGDARRVPGIAVNALHRSRAVACARRRASWSSSSPRSATSCRPSGPSPRSGRTIRTPEITLLTTPPYAELARRSPWFDAVWDDGRPAWTDPAAWLAPGPPAARRRLRPGLRPADLRPLLPLPLAGRAAARSGPASRRGASHPHANPRRDRCTRSSGSASSWRWPASPTSRRRRWTGWTPISAPSACRRASPCWCPAPRPGGRGKRWPAERFARARRRAGPAGGGGRRPGGEAARGRRSSPRRRTRSTSPAGPSFADARRARPPRRLRGRQRHRPDPSRRRRRLPDPGAVRRGKRPGALRPARPGGGGAAARAAGGAGRGAGARRAGGAGPRTTASALTRPARLPMVRALPPPGHRRTPMPAITLPDGSVRRFDGPVTGTEVAAAIGPGLAKAALAMQVDGKLSRPRRRDRPAMPRCASSPAGTPRRWS